MLSKRIGAAWTRPWLPLGVVLVVAAFFRLWQIGSVPPGLFGDEAADGLDALDVLAGRGAVFFPANYGREGFHMWILAGTFRLMGISPLAVRLPSTVAGILTALATYWLGRELVGGLVGEESGRLADCQSGELARRLLNYQVNHLPLLAALYLSTSYWHVHFSRFGIRGIFTPLCGVLAFAAFWRGLNLARGGARAKSARTLLWFGLSGLFLGLAAYFYTASRFFPLFLGTFLILEALLAWRTGRWREAILCRYWRMLLLLCFVAVLAFAPLGHYFVTHPGSFSRRASVVSVARASDPLGQMAQAALANVAQFVVPGRGDDSWNYNLPYRSVFEPPSALLTLAGIAVLLRCWRRPAALFLLTWFPTMLLPAVLATDRWPTLPRVLGVIPGVYFFPAIGVSALTGLLWLWLQRAGGRLGTKSDVRFCLSTTLVIMSLAVHGGLAYRDYFKVWGRAQETFAAFDGEMVAVWQWMRTHKPVGHVYLSSDIYRHPTYMFLGEHATVTGYFQHADPNLSWFDARGALPLPPAGEPATYLLTAGSTPSGRSATFLATYGRERACLSGPDGTCALQVVDLSPGAEWVRSRQPALTLTDHLALIGIELVQSSAGERELWLHWCTSGPDSAAWAGYEVEVRSGRPLGDEWHVVLSLQAFRPMEWVPAGCFVTWHKVDQLAEPLEMFPMQLRLLSLPGREPVVRPDAPDGWHTVQVMLGG